MNVTAVLDGTDASVDERYVYDAYGTPTAKDGSWGTADVAWADSKKNPIRFAGYFWDNETGLCHVRNRMYHPQAGRWLQRDPEEYDSELTLYAYVGSAPTNAIDPYGLWIITRDGKAKALAVAEPGDTIAKLAETIGLEASQANAWLEFHWELHGDTATTWAVPVTPAGKIDVQAALTGCEKYDIPNTVLAYWAGELGSFGKWWVRWKEDAETLKTRGFKVDEQQGWTAEKFENYLATQTGTKELHGLFFWGHGYWRGQRPWWDVLHLVVNGPWSGILTDSSHKDDKDPVVREGYYSDYSAWSLSYKLALGVLWACGTDAARYRFSSGPGAIFQGHPGVLVPHGGHLFGPKMSTLVPPGAQGTRK